ncbi:hypothetical protein HanPI659440_Chr10g0392651 [Helianthus annuus]|nr:hypothetical protein HanPI659440_Chr10g0392651 [Helianthus annuus]
MASIDPSEEHKWVVEIDKILNHQLEIDIETTPSISLFQVPETITSKKPEAYEPQQVGIGPIHHFLPRQYDMMEQKKLAVIQRAIKTYNIKDYKLHILDKVRKLVPTVRSCYDMFLKDDDDTLARVFAIDGVFLLILLHTYNGPTYDYLDYLKTKAYETKQSHDDYVHLSEQDAEYAYAMYQYTGVMELHPLLLQKEFVVTMDNQIEWENALKDLIAPPPEFEVGPKKRLVAQDVLMVENQIPFMVLKEIEETLQASSGSSSNSVNVNLSPSVFRVFCEFHSPLKLCSKSQAPSSVDHLLHYMYYSIVNNVPEQKLPDEPQTQEDDDDDEFKKYPIQNNSWTEEVYEVYTFATRIPYKEIAQAYEQTVSMLETFTQSKALIPSASKLYDESGFQFHSLKEDQGIQNIHRNGKDIYLPIITLNNDSDVILRNLVAYETLTANSDSFPLNEYMGLMCGLIMNKDDVNYLKSQKVITGDMRADEVVKLFTAMSKSIPVVKTEEKSKLREVIDEINEVYESGIWMKIYLLLKKLARWLLVVLKAIGSFVESSWKIVAFMVSIVTVFVLTYQAYCDSFGCDKKTVTLLPYVFS